jgi:hypothetical protein
MLSPGTGPATHAVWGAGLVRPRPSHPAARYRDYALVSTGAAPWLHITMLAISYPGNSLPPALLLLTVGAFWALGDRLEEVFMAGLSAVSLLL